MNKWIRRDFKRRQLFAQNELLRLSLKQALHNRQISSEERFILQAQMNSLPRNSSRTRIRNRCIQTGRARGVYREFKISRLIFREWALNGYIPGIKKASW